MANRLRRKLFVPECTDEGVAIVPFGCTVNGTTHPDGLTGFVTAAVRDEAGEFSLTLDGEPVSCFYAAAAVSNTSDDVDMYCTCDWSTVATTGVLKVRTMTGATQTDPTDNLLIGGFLLVKKTNRNRR